MTQELTKSYSVAQISKMDRETRELTALLSSSKIKIGLEVAMRLKDFRDNRLYLKLDEDSYPTFNHYLKSLDISYRTAAEIIALYESFVLVGGQSIEFLSSIPYHNLTIIKPTHFKKENNEYQLLSSKADLKKAISEAGVLSQEDAMQKRREEAVGPHEHNMVEICYRKCSECGLREYVHAKKN